MSFPTPLSSDPSLVSVCSRVALAVITPKILVVQGVLFLWESA